MPGPKLARGHHKVTPLAWIDDDHFVGTIEHTRKDVYGTHHSRTKACYGWSKGGSFYLYEIQDGHIAKLGGITRADLTGATP